MTRMFSIAVVLTALFTAPLASAGLLFHFTEEDDDVKMTASGSLDTTGLVASVNCEPACEWWGVGYYAEGDNYLMGRLHDPVTEVAFGFNTGTSLSPWGVTSGPFTDYDFTSFVVHEDDGKTFATFTVNELGGYEQGLSIDPDHLVDGVWETSQSWLAEDSSFDSLGLREGIYTITDAVTGETMTIQVGVSVPEPATLGLLGVGLMGIMGIRRRRQAA